MRIGKAPGQLLKKAATAFRSKTDALRARLLVLASLRRRMAMVGAVSRRIHALVAAASSSERQARVEYEYHHGDGKALVVPRKAAAVREKPERAHGSMVDLSEVAMFDEEDHGYPDWTHSLFDDENCYDDGDEDEEDGHGDDLADDSYGVLDAAIDEPSVMEIIRSNREVEGLEFNMDEEIDEACDMFIRRFRNRMNRSF
ncbi:hypothetical protein ACP4OV_023390 [Aristida adscensionis]